MSALLLLTTAHGLGLCDREGGTWHEGARTLTDHRVRNMGVCEGTILAAWDKRGMTGVGVWRIGTCAGRPDLAACHLSRVRISTLLIVGGDDVAVVRLNQQVLAQLRTRRRLEVIPGAGHLFEESRALEEVARLAGGWFHHHLISSYEGQPRCGGRLGG